MLVKLARGEPVFGPMILDLSGPGLPQIVANAGADFVVYDMEAGCLDIGQIKNQIAMTRGLGIAPIVNVASHEYAMLSRPLDSGAMGLMVPVVQTRAEAEALVRVTRYPPRGARGVAFGIAHDDYTGASIAERMALADARTLIIPKIENTAGVESIDAILGVDGIDVAFVGHMDLSVSLGVPGDYAHPRFVAAVDKVIASCKRHGKHGACLVTSPEAARAWIAKGFRIVLYSTDVILLGGALRAGIVAARGGG
jgi:2-keto-3-deoxy-L-rhamnonate aldolase RhmA